MIPKNLGNSYFTTADSAKSGGAIAALKALGESRNGDQRHGCHRRFADPGDQAAITKGANDPARLGDRSVGALPDAELGDAEGHHGRLVRLGRCLPADLFINQANTVGDRRE